MRFFLSNLPFFYCSLRMTRVVYPELSKNKGKKAKGYKIMDQKSEKIVISQKNNALPTSVNSSQSSLPVHQLSMQMAKPMAMMGGLAEIFGGVDWFANGFTIQTALLFGMGTGLLTWGMAQYRKSKSKHKAWEEEQNTLEIIRFALEKNGRISPLELSLHRHISTEKSQLLLDQLQKNGLAELFIAENGTVLYDFNHLQLSDSDKENAEKV
jgi:hypothetical protein